MMEMASTSYSTFKKVWKGGGQACSAIGCSNYRKKNRELSFFRFPKDPKRCKKWMRNLRREGLQEKSPLDMYNNYSICANHFEDSQFMNAHKKDKLIHCAVPTLFDVPNPPKPITLSTPPPEQQQPLKFPDKLPNKLAHSPLVPPSHENPESEEMTDLKKIATLQKQIVRKDIKIRKVLKHFLEIIDGRQLPNFPDLLPACPTSNSKSMKPRRQPQERNGSKSTSQIPPDSELCAVGGESQSELFDEKEPEQPPHLFLGYTNKFKVALERDSLRTRGEQNSVHDSGHCSALFCSMNSRSLDPRTGNTVDMHPFPDPETDKERCLTWITNLRNDFLNLSNVKSKKVCSLHFEESSYYPFIDRTCTNLVPYAVPMRVTQSNEENADLIIHLNNTIETLQHMLEEKQTRNKGLEEKLSRLEIQRDINRKELDAAYENLRRVCFLASLDS